MTTAFLNFARPQALQLENLSLDELIEECVRELQPMFQAHNALCVRSPTVREGNQDLTVPVDPRLLRQSLLNLLRNAAEAIPESQLVRRVTIETNTEKIEGKRWAVISISDTGRGITPSDLQKIFIPFFTTKSKGHGIGLALAHRVITEHGGTLTASNNVDGGAMFAIRLPMVD
jgi:signal transduction histidine kinase